MQEKKSTKVNKLDEISNLKSLMSLNDSLFEATKTAIKTKNNEIALKMIDNLSDRPDLWTEYVTLAILWQNFPVFKQMVEKFNIDLSRNVNINAAMFSNELSSDPSNKSQKLVENKENYLDVECPVAILAAIGGDIDIYKYLTDRGVNSSSVGHIGLTKKLKNSVLSNVIGACAFYGRINLLHFILEKTASSTKLDINQKSIEKKSKTKQYSLQKEFADFTPVHLALNDLNSEDDSIEILKYLQRYKCDMSAVDWNKNNILHLAVKFNKKRVVKFILEDLKLLEMIDVLNKEGQTATALAKSLEVSDILSYLQNFNSNPQASQDLDQELLDLIENTSTKKKKTKKDKKKKEENLGVLGTINEFQETLKPPKEKPLETPKIEEKPKEVSNLDEKTKSQETYLEDDYANDNFENGKEETNTNKQYYERKSYFTNYGDNKIKKNNKYGYNTANSGNSYRTNQNYSNRNYQKEYDDYEYEYTSYNRDNYYDNYSKNSYGDDKKYGKYTSRNNRPTNKSYETNTNTSTINVIASSVSEIQTVGSNQNIISETHPKTSAKAGVIVGLPSKTERKNITNTNDKEIPKETEKEVLLENNKPETKVSGNQIPNEKFEANVGVEVKVPEETKIESISKESKQVDNTVEDTHPSAYKISKIEELEYENEDDYMGEENFITDENLDDKEEEPEQIDLAKKTEKTLEEKDTRKEQPAIAKETVLHNLLTENKINIEHTQQTIPLIGYSETTEKELKLLTANCFDLQKEIESERRVNEELRAHIKEKLMPVRIDIHKINIVNSEENISDILQLANDELKQQSKRIFDLNSKLEFLEGKDVKNLNENDLNYLKDFYSARLGAVIDALNNLKSN